MARPDWIEVGRVRRSHGLQGEVLVTVESDNPDRFQPDSVVYARPRKPGKRGGGATGSGCRTPPAPDAIAVPEAAAAAVPQAAVPAERRQLVMESAREGNRDCLIVRFAGIEDRNAADALRGFVLEIPASELPELEEGEFYPFDLEGLEVRDQTGAKVGTVLELFDTPVQSILRIRLESGAETAVPFLMEAVPTVDVAGGFVQVDSSFLA